MAVAAALAGAAQAAGPVPRFARVVLVVLENREESSVLGSPNAPGLNALAHRYARLDDYTGIAHPSLPNYLALVSGSTHGITSDCTSCVVSGPNLADLLERARMSWKVYAEGIPQPGFTGGSSGRYVKKHVPFLYFSDVADSPARLQNVVGLDRFAGDLAHGRLPRFSLVVPDLCHDMHDCSTATGDSWTASFLRPLLASPQLRGGVVFVTFDEGKSDDGGGGRVVTLALGPLVRPGAVSTQPLDHYSLLATIERGLGLQPLLGEAAKAAPVTGIWRTPPPGD